ncbi:hypothetical protein I302_102428 [Kwoniella bestiolae CBS 10118]|uniref:Uncharacterized protein n=1 Tax=Kwoniella bestiolae CBS 10118 TaxID=1296100 RepID=A0A1B9GEZ6_9TREE|nr:hypothetical protein I302_01119 [Kwoniella bestiolae CBS 10118]OCF29610.1 hypothetical protein I302_01119 [Kwoniella bestiolae CBS 10118]
MVTEPRLIPVSTKIKPKWSTISDDITLTIYTLPYTSMDIHLVHRGKPIVKQTFSPLSSSGSAMRRITCGSSSAAVRYDSIQTPMISGMKMRETFQLAFTSAEDCRSFLRMMDGFFNIVESTSNTTPQSQGFSEEPSQLLLSSPSKASTIRSFPFSSPTKSVKRRTSSQLQSQQTSITQQRSRTNTKAKKAVDQPLTTSIPLSTNDSTMQKERVGTVQLGEELTPSPHDEATERLKRGLLGTFKPSPTPPEEAPNRMKLKSPSLPRDTIVQSKSHPAYEDKGVMTADVWANSQGPFHSQGGTRFSQNSETQLSSSFSRNIPSASRNHTKTTDTTPDQPLISFSQSPHNSQDLIIQRSMSQPRPNIISPSNAFTWQEGSSERLPEASHPVMLTQGESEAERVRRGKRKRSELEDELEEEEQVSQNSHLSGLAHHTSSSDHHSAPPQSLYPIGIYYMSSSDLEEFVFGVVLEQGFEPLLTRIVRLMEAQLEVVSQTQSQQRHHTEDTASPQQGVVTKNESPYQQEDTDRCTGLDTDADYHDYLHNPFHNPHSRYDVYPSRERHSQASGQSSSSHYHSVPDEFHSQSQTLACASQGLHRSSPCTAKQQSKYSQGVQDHSQIAQHRSNHVPDSSNPDEQSRVHSHHSQDHSPILQDQSQQPQQPLKLGDSSHGNHSQPPAGPSQAVDNPQYTQPGNSYPEYDYDQEEYSVFPRLPGKQSLGFLLNETETQIQTQVSAFSPTQPSAYNQMNNTYSYEMTYDKTNKFDEEDEEIANISREFDCGIPPGSGVVQRDGGSEDVGAEKEYDYDNEVDDEDLELEKEIEDGV